ncbi:MAG: 16S rRNA (guanine(966)-N(2))-methyltransferase RsmD [Chloroflexi bacterium]|nr:16S rRNA (guanine(966)-N(2))-methyltransferase RsmD [Chloroflexota bacterium]MCC6895629.1 16S rRNA (guanine(966)-N(2))-methyltransferase RsmD [Anaerolineae bacterium]
MPLRVIGGTAKGRQLKLVPGDTTRPIMDRVKEALFNIIGRDIYDSVFLDLFAGTGSVGIEALSRGAERAVFIDMERKAVQTVNENLAIAKLADKATVRQGDALKVVAQPPTYHFHYVYIAPPQYKGLWSTVLQTLDNNPLWLHDDTEFIVQIDPNEETTIELKHMETTDQRRYGNTLLWFLGSKLQSTDGQPQEE